MRIGEDLPTPNAALDRVRAAELLALMGRLAAREPSAAGSSSLEQLLADINDELEHALFVRDVLRARSAVGNRCLRCGSTEIASRVFERHDENAAAGDVEPLLVIPHLGCSGSIVQRDEEDPDWIRADWIQSAVYYSPDGVLIDK
jgi:hypothetical protein